MKQKWTKAIYIPYELNKLSVLLKWEIVLLVFSFLLVDVLIIIKYSEFALTIKDKHALILDWIKTTLEKDFKKSDLMVFVGVIVFTPLVLFFITRYLIGLLENVKKSSLNYITIQIIVSGIATISMAFYIIIVPHSIITISILIFIVITCTSINTLKILALHKAKGANIIWTNTKRRYNKFSFKTVFESDIVINFYLFFFLFLAHLTIIFGLLSKNLEHNVNLTSMLPDDSPSVIGLESIKQYSSGYLMIVIETDEGKTERHTFEKENNIKLIDEYIYLTDSEKRLIKNNKKHYKYYSRIDEDGRVIANDEKLIKETYYYPIKASKHRKNRIVWEANLTKTKLFIDKLVNRLEGLPEVLWCEYKKPVSFFKKNQILFFDIGDIALIYSRLKEALFDKTKAVSRFNDILVKYNNPRLYSNRSGYLLKGNKMFVIMIKPSGDYRDINFLQMFYNKVKDRVTLAKKELNNKDKPNIKIAYGGQYKRKYDFNIIMEKDRRLIYLIVPLMIIGIITIYFRKIIVAFIIAIPLFMTIIWLFGIAYLFFGYFNILSSFWFVMLMVLGACFGVNFLSEYFKGIREDNSITNSLYIMLKETRKINLITLYTFIAILVVLFFSKVKGYSEFAIIGITAGVICYGIMYYVIPIIIIIENKISSYIKLYVKPYIINLFYRKGLNYKYLIIAAKWTTLVFFLINFYLIYHFFNANHLFLLIPVYLFILPYLAILKGIIILLSWVNYKYDNLLESIFKKPSLVLSVIGILIVLSFIMANKAKFEYNIIKVNEMNMDSYLIEEKVKGQFNLSTSPTVITANNEDIKKLYNILNRRLREGQTTNIALLDNIYSYIPTNKVEKIILINEIKKLTNEFKKSLIKKDINNSHKNIVDQIVNFENKYLNIDPALLSTGFTNKFTGYNLKTNKGFMYIYPTNGLTDDPIKLKAYLKEIGNIKHIAIGEDIILKELLISLENEIFYITVGIFILVILVLYIGFRDINIVVLIVGSLLIGGIFMFGITNILGIEFNLLNIIVLPIIITIGLYINVNLGYKYYLSGNILDSLSYNAKTISITFLISAFAFGVLLFAESNSFNTIASIALIGVISIYISTLFFIPAMVLLLKAFNKDKPIL